MERLNKMTLPNEGKHKKIKYIKCNNCKSRVPLIEENIIHIANLKYIVCDQCGEQIILHK
jgi:DNA-directed RNA polymerase subunit RPC12/RpoP